MIICPNCYERIYETENEEEEIIMQEKRQDFLLSFIEAMHDYWFRYRPKDWEYQFKLWFYKNFAEIPRADLDLVHIYYWGN